jgi:hypothetical protein
MGFTDILTIIFIVLKLLGVITWAWWVCLLPGNYRRRSLCHCGSSTVGGNL